MTIFDDLRQSFANLIGTDINTAGYILAFILIIVVVIVLEWVIDRDGSSRKVTILVSLGIGITFSALFNLVPLWVPFVMGMLLALILFRPFGGGESPMG